MTATTPGYDAIGANAGGLPAGQHAGYVTGSGGVAWVTAQFSRDPGAIRICQDPGATVATADVLDVESGAATVQDCPGWVVRARDTYAAGTRPGQRQPMIYCARNNLTPVCNELSSAGITGVPLWLAEPGISAAAAVSTINGASGPYPVKGVQYAWPSFGLPANGSYDASEFDTAWLAEQSGIPLVSTVSVGNSGPAVLGLQALLNGQGSGIAADGLYGLGTLASVQGFQEAHGLVKDGIVGPATWAALLRAQPVPVTPPPPPPPDPKSYPAPARLADKALSAGSVVTFTWGAVAGAAAYLLQVQVEKPAGWSMVVSEAVAGTSKVLSLSPRSTYRWRVAVNATGRKWPAWATFKTA